MHEIVMTRLAQIEDLCLRSGVRRLDVFGSVVDDSFDPDTSDVDVLVEFDVRAGFDHFGSYFSLKEGLEAILGRPVDLVTASGIRNPYFRDQVMRTKETLYAA